MSNDPYGLLADAIKRYIDYLSAPPDALYENSLQVTPVIGKSYIDSLGFEMPIYDRDGRTARESVSRFLSRGVRDGEMASALDISLSTYSRRKDRSDFPSFADLRLLSQRLGVDETALLVDFGYIDVNSLNDDLRERYEAYRRALDVIGSMRTAPSQPETA